MLLLLRLIVLRWYMIVYGWIYSLIINNITWAVAVGKAVSWNPVISDNNSSRNKKKKSILRYLLRLLIPELRLKPAHNCLPQQLVSPTLTPLKSSNFLTHHPLNHNHNHNHNPNLLVVSKWAVQTNYSVQVSVVLYGESNQVARSSIHAMRSKKRCYWLSRYVGWKCSSRSRWTIYCSQVSMDLEEVSSWVFIW